MGDRELRRRYAGQYGDGVFVLAARLPCGDELALCGLQLRQRTHVVPARSRAELVLTPGDVRSALVVLDHIGQQILHSAPIPADGSVDRMVIGCTKLS
jgi:hypothetical protein